MGYGIGHDNALTIGGTGYGGGGGYGLSQARSQELDQDFNIEQSERNFGLAEKEFGLQEDKLAMLEADYAEKKRRYDELFERQKAEAGLATGSGGTGWRREAFSGLYGEDYQPTPTQLRPDVEGSAGGGSGLRSGNYVNSKVDLSDPGKALSAARYARSMGENIQRYAPMTQNPYLDIEKRILNSLRG